MQWSTTEEKQPIDLELIPVKLSFMRNVKKKWKVSAIDSVSTEVAAAEWRWKKSNGDDWLIASGRTDCVNGLGDFDEEWGMESLVDTYVDIYDDNDDNNDLQQNKE